MKQSFFFEISVAFVEHNRLLPNRNKVKNQISQKFYLLSLNFVNN